MGRCGVGAPKIQPEERQVGETSSIEWTEATWNPTTGCTKISPGCKHCYAERMSKRLRLMGQTRYADGFALRMHSDALDAPRHWRKPKRIFVNSMSDLFHEDVTLAFIQDVFSVMRDCYWHDFQVLTKRADRLAQIAEQLEWPTNVWMGVSVESSDYLWRVDRLRAVPASIRFLSIEPLLGPVDSLNLEGIDWVIVGGESGPGARRLEPEWVRAIQTRCFESHTPFFFKQWGGTNKKRTGRELDGRTWDQMPSARTHQAARSDMSLAPVASR
jgi:protein gp37